MDIKFEKIEIQNFKSVGKMLSLDFNDFKGLNFVYGKNLDVPNAKNGSGKSSIFCDSLFFALFGKTLKNTSNKYIPNRNVFSKLEPYVKLYLRSSGQLYSIKTYGKVSSSGMSSGVEILKLADDESVIEDLTQSSVAKSKEYIEKNIIGCSFDIFKSSIVISYADFMNFYEGMKKDQKRKYVENLFKLNCFGDMYSNIKDDANSLKKETSNLKLNILSENDRIEEYSAKSDAFEKSLEDKKAAAKKLVLEKAEEVKKLVKEAKEVIAESVEDSIKDKKKEILEAIDKITDAMKKLEKNRTVALAQSEKNEEMIAELKSLYSGLCPKCTKMISEKYDFSSKEKEIEKSKALVEKADNALESLKKKLEEKKEAKKAVEEEIDKSLATQRKKDRLDDAVLYAKKELVALKKNYDDLSASAENPFLSLLDKAQDALKSLKEKLVSMTRDFKHLEILKEVCSENGVKKFIIKDIVKLLNSLIQKYLNEIGCEFIVFFDESFDFKFLTTTGECEFSSFSAGERQRIQIATILAFRDLILNNNVSSNLLVIDELLDANVDTVCIQNVMSILKKKAEEDNQNIFIISHRSELADDESIWDSIIKIEKSNGCSTYQVR